MSTLKQKSIFLKAGSQESYSFNGNYLRLYTSLAGVNVRTEAGDDFDLENGNDIRFENSNFQRLELTSLSGIDEEIVIQYGQDVKFSAPKINAEVTNKEYFLTRPRDFATNNLQFSMTANSALTLLPANSALNANGLVIDVMAQLTTATAGNIIFLITHTAVPASANEGQILAITKYGFSNLINVIDKEKIYIPANNGIYLYTWAATGAGGLDRANLSGWKL